MNTVLLIAAAYLLLSLATGLILGPMLKDNRVSNWPVSLGSGPSPSGAGVIAPVPQTDPASSAGAGSLLVGTTKQKSKVIGFGSLPFTVESSNPGESKWRG